jgi:DNA-directed RNA polymerase subunit RPC12/RpoP
MKDFKCVICEKTIKDQYGNNPDPIKTRGKCCDSCNWKVVIPARMVYYS